jgi:transcriptional regulator with XRE-family HTH domain
MAEQLQRVPNQKLQQERARRGWKQQDVAKQIELPDVRTYRRWELGESFPSAYYRAKLCVLFEKSEEDLGLLRRPFLVEIPALPSLDDKRLQDSMVSPDSASVTSLASNPNRQRFLAKVRSFWIEGVLDKSLHGAALIALGLHEQSDALTNPWSLIFQQPHQPAHPLLGGTHITQVYDHAGGELLILGEPGSGKTTLLLELAHDLLTRAEQDDTHPMPVILNLSSWAVKRQPIADWLVEELNDKYQVPRRIGRTWVPDDLLLLLLDGLDEVTPAYQAACVEAINTYRQEHGLVALVVCSRSSDYLAQTARVLLDCAVVVQPLTAEQVDDYISSGGEKLSAIRTALRDDPVLQELTTTPLMLSVLAIAYAGKSLEELPASGSLEEHRQQIFATYTERMLQRRGASKRYTPEQTTFWLIWLARQLVRHRQTAFYLEQLQFDWLPTHRFRWLKLCSGIGCIVGLFCFLIFALGYLPTIVRLQVLLVVGFLFGVLNALLYIVLNGLILNLESEQDSTRNPAKDAWSWTRIRRKLAAVLGNRVIYGFLFVVPNLLFPLRFAPYNVFNEEIFLNGMMIWIAYAVIGKLDAKIEPVEVVSWSWLKVRRHLPKILFFGLLGGLIAGSLIDLSIFFWRHALQRGLVPFFLPSLVLALGIILSLVLILGVSHEVLATSHRTRPNQGIRNSLRNGVVLGLIYGLIVGVLSGIILSIVRVVAYTHIPIRTLILVGLSDGIGFGLATAGVVWLRSGGIASLQHFFLRLRLWRAGFMPWQYARFLDYASECILLRKVGGGYIFIHGLLLDYFALYNPTNR